MSGLTTSMKEIASASEQTQKIIKSIDEVAFQTNLMALKRFCPLRKGLWPDF